MHLLHGISGLTHVHSCANGNGNGGWGDVTTTVAAPEVQKLKERNRWMIAISETLYCA